MNKLLAIDIEAQPRMYPADRTKPVFTQMTTEEAPWTPAAKQSARRLVKRVIPAVKTHNVPLPYLWFVNHDQFTLQGSEFNGAYFPDYEKAIVAIDAVDAPSILVHEIGHHVWRHGIPPKEQRKFRSLHTKGVKPMPMVEIRKKVTDLGLNSNDPASKLVPKLDPCLWVRVRHITHQRNLTTTPVIDLLDVLEEAEPSYENAFTFACLNKPNNYPKYDLVPEVFAELFTFACGFGYSYFKGFTKPPADLLQWWNKCPRTQTTEEPEP